jgi:hypothetical protein
MVILNSNDFQKMSVAVCLSIAFSNGRHQNILQYIYYKSVRYIYGYRDVILIFDLYVMQGQVRYV